MFVAGQVTLEYWNPPHDCERIVELPMAVWFARKFPDFFEIGAVLPENGITGHLCYDLLESRWNAINRDGEFVDLNNRNLLCISTIEHMGCAEYGNACEDLSKSERFLCKVRDQCNHYLVTFPLGRRRDLEAVAVEVGGYILKRTGPGNKWAFTDEPPSTFQYGNPYPFGNAIFVLTNVKELLP